MTHDPHDTPDPHGARPAIELTAEQHAAVNHRGSPLVVLAGPGTGKTRVIVHRVASLLAEGRKPESIVAVTFTVKAANQLRERLAGLVGPTSAARVNAHTIHAFGLRLVRRFGDVLGLPPEVDQIDAVQASRLLGDIVHRENLFPESRRAGLAALVSTLVEDLDALANVGRLPSECLEHVRRAGQTPPKDEAEAHARERFASLARVFDLYTRERWRRGWLTIDDLILLPIRLLRDSASSASIVRADYTSFIVDEFQDCNPAQIRMLQLLAPPPADVCVVGDDDQTIYAFRGADDRAFDRFTRIWPGATVLELSGNYRSRPEIVETCNAVIVRAGSRFRPDKSIRPARDHGPRGPADGVEAVKLTHDADDGETIAAMILADRERSARDGTPRPWSSYAVIARGHSDLDRVAGSLALEGIPHERRRTGTLFDDDGVADVMAWIEWLVNPNATWAARRVLTRPPCRVPPEVVVRWESDYEAAARRHRFDPDGHEHPGRFAEWLDGEASAEGPARRVLEQYAEMSGLLAGRADDAVFRIITRTDPAHADLLPQRERARRVTMLLTLLSLARSKQSRLPAPGDLRAFWHYVEDLRAFGEVKEAPRSLSAAADREDEEDDAIAPDGRVQLLTAHAAKGLEFDTVFVTKVRPTGFPSANRNSDRWRPPPELLGDEAGPDVDSHADEERRLFYVACTRAERRLVLLAKFNKKAGSALNFFDEIVRTPARGLPVTVREQADVLDAAAAQGVSLLTRGAGGEQGAEVFAAMRRAARVEAALALEAVESGQADPAAVEQSTLRLRAAAQKLAAIASAQRNGSVPAWLQSAGPESARLAERLAAAVRGQATAPEPGRIDAAALVFRPLTAPLHLSYSSVSGYHKCARCWYLHNVLRVPEKSRMQTHVGTVIHGTLKTFYDRWTRADSEGLRRPGLQELLALGRQNMIQSLGADDAAAREEVDQVDHLLRAFMKDFHDEAAHVVDTEREVRWDYMVDGVRHELVAKLDRLDLMPDGGYRVVDYKTGKPWKSLIEPAPDDLQMGIYALALREGPWECGDDLHGSAEYWCLSVNQRGTIRLEDLDLDAVRGQINTAVQGMLAGKFPRGAKCDGLCTLFDGGSPGAPSRQDEGNT